MTLTRQTLATCHKPSQTSCRMLLWLSILCTAALGGVSGEAWSRVVPDIGEYVLVDNQMSWTDAYQACKSLDGGPNLAVVNSLEEADALRGMLLSHNVSVVHIGFHDRFVEGTYVTITNLNVDAACSSLWAPGYPQGGLNADCGAFTPQGLIDEYCDASHSFVCELPPRDGYEVIEGIGTYKYHTEFVSWPEAWQTCEAEGGHLVVINSELELTAISVKYPPQSWPWVGVHRSFGEKEFVTVFNQPLSETGYSTWFPGFPYPEYEDEVFPYVCIDYYPPTVGLRTYGDGTVLQFICEKELAQNQCSSCNQ